MHGGPLSWGNLFRQLRGEAAKPPLVLGDHALQALLDKSWSRRHRWEGFQIIAAATDVYNPDVGGLPALLRGYGVQNGLQPYEEREIRDPRLWAQLGLAADHADFIGFVSQYASQHPSTRTTTELLFLLDKLAQASLDALVTLIGTVPEADLQWTLKANRRAYDAIITHSRLLPHPARAPRFEVVAGDRRLLRRDQAGHPEEHPAHDSGRVSGQRCPLSHRRDFLEAGQDRGCSPVMGRHHHRCGGRLCDGVVASARGNPRCRRAAAGLLVTIGWILDGEQGRWVMFSIARLRQFGYHLDTF